jgi:GNAT superfamily N-acetyltransferase
MCHFAPIWAVHNCKINARRGVPGAYPGAVDVSVRRGVAEDAPALARMRWRWRIEEKHGAAHTDRDSFVDFVTRWMIDHLATHLPFVAEVDGALAGMAWLMLSDRVPSPSSLDRRFGDVQSVYVVPERRNAGTGAALMAAVLKEARDRELEFVTVHSSERAVAMYRRAGFGPSAQWLEVRFR